MLGALISAGASLAGGLLGQQTAQDNRTANMWQNMMNLNEQRRVNEENRAFAREINAENLSSAERTNLANIRAASDINAATLADKDLDRALQREFAQSGIRWRADDARAAGIHPIYALGGPGASYSPGAIQLASPSRVTPVASPGAAAQASAGSSVVSGNPMGNALASMGQDIGRALMATSTGLQRDAAFEQTSRDLTLQNMTLRNELLSSQIAKLRGQVGPAFPPVPEANKPEDRPQMFTGGYKWATDPLTSNAQSAEDRYGELSDFIFGPYILYRDTMHNIQQTDIYKQLMGNIRRVKPMMQRQ